MIVLDLSILNQKGTPMFNSDLTANRPAAGIVGRIFIAIDSPYGIFRDTGTAWDQVSSAGGGATLYSGDGTLSGNRTVSSGGFNLTFAPQTTFSSSLTATTGGSSYSVLGSNALTFAAGFSSINIGNVYGANGAINAQNFLGNATFAQANLASAMVNVNKIDFGSGGHTITMTQSTGIRAMTGVQNQIQFTGSHNGTISHAAVSQNLGFFRESGSTRTLTITNAYSHLINALDDYGAGFTFTNRWGIYQAGASDTNYFAANVLIGSTTSTGQRLQVTGDAIIKGTGTTSATSALTIQNSAASTTFQVLNSRGVLINDPAGSNAMQINGTGFSNAMAIGLQNGEATATGGLSMAIGRLSSATGSDTIAFGPSTIASGNQAIAIGRLSDATANLSIAIGYNANSLHANCIVFNAGGFGQSTAANQFIAHNITDVYFGEGPRTFNSNAINYTIHGSGGATSVVNTNGGNITIAGGKGVGIGTPGDVIISTPTIAASGNTLQSLTDRWWVKGNLGTLSNVASPNASAQLQIDSSTQGFLPPRMTNAQRTAIGTPAIGLIVYCTDAVEGLYVYKSTGWTFVI
jgi:hypothetical protein